MADILPQWSSCKAVRNHFLECSPPFVVLGLIVGLLHYILATNTAPTFLSYFTDGAFPIQNDLLDVLSEHAAPKTLAYGFFTMLMLVFISRILFGSASSKTKWFVDLFVSPLFKFNLTLAAAMASLIAGLAIAALLVGYYLAALAFLAFTLFPIIYTAILSLSVRLAFPLSYGSPSFDDDPIVSRLVGLLSLLIFAVTAIAWPYIEWFLSWVTRVISHCFP